MAPMTKRELLTEIFKESASLAMHEVEEYLRYEIAQKRIGVWRQTHYMETVRLRIRNGRDLVLVFTDKQGQEIEEGVPSIDLRRTMLAGRKYVDVPFYFASDKDLHRGALLPPQVRRRAPPVIQSLLDQRARDTSPNGNFFLDTRLKRKEFPEENRLKESHQFGITQGMIRHGTANKWGKISQFATIRRLSDKSPAESWIVPRQPGVRLEPGANQLFQERVKTYADNSIKALRKQGFDL